MNKTLKISLVLTAFVGLLILIFKKNKTVGVVNSKGWLKPVQGPLTSGFGARKDPTRGTQTFHNGQDIGVAVGTKVVAPRSGTIKIAAYDTEGGNQIVMVHDNGWFTGYAHLSKFLVKPNDKVKQGQVIALSGATGQHITGPHIHFTLTDPKGIKVDPKLYVYT